MKRYPLISTSLALLCSTAFAYETIHEALPGDGMQVHQYRLDNGLTVFISPNPETPRFYAEIVVRAGSKNDPAETTGLAHYLEHLLFKGNREFGTIDYEAEKPHLDRIRALYEKHLKEDNPEKRAALYKQINEAAQIAAQWAVPNEFDKMYTALGADDINAHTSNDETVYKASFPANRFSQWARVESSRFIDPVFRLFHTELETVYEEKNRAMDNASRLLFEALYRELFPVHPYGQQTTLGEAEHLKRPSLVNIRKFYDTWYVPNNMALCISGNVDPATILPEIEKHFGRWQAKPLPELPDWEDPPLNEIRRVEVKYPGEPFVIIAFPTVPQNHPDAPALRVLDMIMDNSTAGLLNLNLNQQQQVRRAGSYPRLMNDRGIQHFYAIPKPGQTHAEAEQLLLDQVKRLHEGRFDANLLPAILTDFKKNHLAGLEQDATRVERLRDAFIARTEWRTTLEELDRLQAVTKDDVMRVAKTYLTPKAYVSGHRVEGPHSFTAMDKPAIDPIPIDPTRRSAFTKKLLAEEVPPATPSWIVAGEDYRSIPSSIPGAALWSVANPINSLYALEITFDAGTRQHPELALLARLFDQAGTASMSPTEVKQAWYQLGGNFGIGAEGTHTKLVLGGLDENLPESIDLLWAIVNGTAISDEAFANIKAFAAKERAEMKTKPESLSKALIYYQRFGQHSPYHTWLSDEALAALTPEDVLKPLRDLMQQAQVTIHYTGTRDPQSVDRALAAGWLRDANAGSQPPRPQRPVRQPGDNEIWFLHQETAQSQVRIEWTNGAYEEAVQPMTQVFNEYFGGGMSSLVFQELREARALAYVAWAYYISARHPDDPNLVVGQIGCQTDKTVDAVSAFIDLFDNMPLTQQRFDGARNGLMTQYRTETTPFRAILQQRADWDRMNLSEDPRPARLQQIPTLTLDTLKAFHQERIKGQVRRISIMGDRNRIDMEALKKFGTVREVTADECFR